MIIVELKERLQNINKGSSIFLLMVLIILFLFLSCSEKESEKTNVIHQTLVSSFEGSNEKMEEQTIITIDLPGLPKGAKKLEMVLIKPGTFIMGSSKDERGRSDREWPPHKGDNYQALLYGKVRSNTGAWEGG